jgi:hypothetical protein
VPTAAEHLDATVANFLGSLLDLLRGALLAAEASLNELLAVLLEKLPGANVADRGDLDEFREAVTDLRGCRGRR